MSMKITKLTTYWSADQAYDILSLLDELRDALWETYGDDIVEIEIARIRQSSQNEDTLASDYECEDDFYLEDIPF